MARRGKGPRPRVILNCVADGYTGPGERIIEFSSENGGGLIAFRQRHDGTLLVDIYRTDPTVRVVHDTSDRETVAVAHYPEPTR